MQLHYNNAPLTEDDHVQLSETFKLSLNVVTEVVEALKKGDRPPLYAGTVRQRIRELCAAISKDVAQVAPEEAQAPPAPQAAPTTTSEPAPRGEREDVAEYASNQLMRVMTEGDGHFLITEEGVCAINQANPPSIEKSYEVIGNVLKLKELTAKMEDKGCWMLGSIVSELEKFHGEAFSISQVSDQSEKSYNTIGTAVAVFNAFEHKRYDVSFTHHKEAHYANIEKNSKKLILHKAETHKLNSKHVRSLCQIVKKMGGDQVVTNIRSHEQAMDLIDKYKNTKAIYYCYNDGVWSWVNGLDGELPDGAVVLDTKNKMAYANGEPMGDIVKSTKKKDE
jgi:hypothetical protein